MVQPKVRMIVLKYIGLHWEYTWKYVDNEEGSTIRLYYKSTPYKMYGIMHILRNIKTYFS